jgi:isopentenyldiphosphate isomerase
MARLEVPLVNESGRRIGYGDRWQTHRVRNGPHGPILGRRHIGITIALVDDAGRILIAHRRHRIFDRVWTLSGDTHPYRYGWGNAEVITVAARRCAKEDLGIETKGWRNALAVSYSARDPRDPRYCENELLSLMVTKYDGPVYMNEKNVYELLWAELPEISKESAADLQKEPVERKYAPWVHAVFALSPERIREALSPKTLGMHQNRVRARRDSDSRGFKPIGPF